MYIHLKSDWSSFSWDNEQLMPLLAHVRHRQGKLIGRMKGLGFSLQSEAVLQTLTLEIVKSNEIEGKILDQDQVRSSIARRLGMDIAALVSADRHVEGVVEMLLDATQNYNAELSDERLFDWHAALFPTGRSGMRRITVAGWRTNEAGPMQVVSGPMGKERVHYEAPEAGRLADEMNTFLAWFNKTHELLDPVLKAAIAHFWFVTIHPFDDGNGRIARCIADMQLARADGSAQRFYSMSAQIRKERKAYYDILESSQKGNMDITAWLIWFLNCLDRALTATDGTLSNILYKARYWEILAKKNLNDRQRLMLNKLLDGFEGKLNSSKWAKITKTSGDTALRDITSLVEQNVLQKNEGGGRSTSYDLVEIKE